MSDKFYLKDLYKIFGNKCHQSRGCHSRTFCTNICDRGQNRNQESNIKKPASQRTSSVGEGSFSQQPMCYANTTINTNVVDEVYGLVYGKGSRAKYLVVGNCSTVKV